MYLIECQKYKEVIESGKFESLDLDTEGRDALKSHQKVLIKELSSHKRVYVVVLEEYEWVGIFHKVDMKRLKKLFDSTKIDAYAQSVDVCRKMANSATLEEINKIIDECGGQDVTKIDIDDDGLVMITSTDNVLGKKAIEWIKNLTHEITVGEVYEGTVMKIVTDRNSGSEIGAIVELLPGQDGMVHISQFKNERIDKVSSIVKEGDKLKVKVIKMERGKIDVSMKALLPKPEGYVEPPKRPRRDDRRGGDRRRHLKERK